MIEQTIDNMMDIIAQLHQWVLDDIEDVRNANHESLLDRNDIKLANMENLAQYKIDLNNLLVQAVQNGDDVDQYRQKVDDLEKALLELSVINSKLGSIVLPVKQMYKEIIDDISRANGGSLIEVMA
jgi:hypothetical protein